MFICVAAGVFCAAAKQQRELGKVPRYFPTCDANTTPLTSPWWMRFRADKELVECGLSLGSNRHYAARCGQIVRLSESATMPSPLNTARACFLSASLSGVSVQGNIPSVGTTQVD